MCVHMIMMCLMQCYKHHTAQIHSWPLVSSRFIPACGPNFLLCWALGSYLIKKPYTFSLPNQIMPWSIDQHQMFQVHWSKRAIYLDKHQSIFYNWHGWFFWVAWRKKMFVSYWRKKNEWQDNNNTGETTKQEVK